MKRNILLCVAGLTPQIITETLYVLAVKEKKRIDEIRVITTLLGRKLIKERLFDSGVFRQFCDDYPKQTANLYFDLEKCLYLLNVKKTGVPESSDLDEDRLPDIRTTGENKKAANQICEIVRYWTHGENKETKKKNNETTRIFASVAGGRKTMGNYLAFAMSLFGRTGDTLSHVLVDEEFERPRKPPLDFYYEPPVPRPCLDLAGNPALTVDGKPLTTDMANTTLADIPYVRLNRILGENYGNVPGEYESFVEQAQNELDLLETEHELKIYLAEKRITIAKCDFHLTPRDFLIYAIFALRRKTAATDDASAIAYEDLTLEDFDRSLHFITKADGDEFGIEKIEGDGDYDFLLTHLKRKDGKIILDAKTKKFKNSISEGITRINTALKEKRIPARYQIKAQRKEGKISYNRIALSPGKIVFIPKI